MQPSSDSSFSNFAQRMQAREARRMEEKFEVQGLQFREEFIDSVERAATKNPQIDKSVFVSILDAYDAEFADLRQGVAHINATAPNRTTANIQAGKLKGGFLERVKQRVSHHGSDANEAMIEIAKENRPQTIFTPLIKTVYNSDKGGLQTGGAIGAAAATGLGYYIAGASGMGGIMKVAITGVIGLAGAFISNKLLPQESTHMPVELRSAMKTPTIAKSLSKEPAPATAPLLKKTAPKADMDAALNGAFVKNDAITPASLTGSEIIGFTPDTPSAAPNKSGPEIA